MRQLHLNDPSTLAKKHQGETNDRLDEVIRQLQENNRLLALLVAGNTAAALPGNVTC